MTFVPYVIHRVDEINTSIIWSLTLAIIFLLNGKLKVPAANVIPVTEPNPNNNRYKKEVFKDFFVINTYDTSKQKCIGLGLPIAEKIIKKSC